MASALPCQAGLCPEHTEHVAPDCQVCTSQVETPIQEICADAAVNSGNTLAARAELMPAAEAIQMLDSAQQAYEAAFTHAHASLHALGRQQGHDVSGQQQHCMSASVVASTLSCMTKLPLSCNFN